MTEVTRAKRNQLYKKGHGVYKHLEMGEASFLYLSEIVYFANMSFMIANQIVCTGSYRYSDRGAWSAVEAMPEIKERAKALVEKYAAYDVELIEFNWADEYSDAFPLYASDLFMGSFEELSEKFDLRAFRSHVYCGLLEEFAKAEAQAFKLSFLFNGGSIWGMTAKEDSFYQACLHMDLLECLHKCLELSKSENNPEEDK